MIKKTIKYHDYEGNEKEDDFYFHLTQIDLNKINGDPSLPGGIEETIQRIQKNEDYDEMLRVIDLLISRSYGVRLPDGNFVKRNASGLPLYESFVNTEAYDNLMMELLSNERALPEFLMSCLTTNAQKQLKEQMAKQEAEVAPKLTPINN